jgi:hypothetical protein
MCGSWNERKWTKKKKEGLEEQSEIWIDKLRGGGDRRINEGCKTVKTYSRMQHPQSLFGYLRLSQHCTV